MVKSLSRLNFGSPRRNRTWLKRVPVLTRTENVHGLISAHMGP